MWERAAALPTGRAATSPRANGSGAAQRTNGDARIPVQSGSGTLLLHAESICAIRADGRYTHVLDLEREHFCNLSITELESRLDPAGFMRVHRSHIVQVQHVRSIRRKGDGAIILVGDKQEMAIPVSRSALPKLKARLPAIDRARHARQEAASLS